MSGGRRFPHAGSRRRLDANPRDTACAKRSFGLRRSNRLLSVRSAFTMQVTSFTVRQRSDAFLWRAQVHEIRRADNVGRSGMAVARARRRELRRLCDRGILAPGARKLHVEHAADADAPGANAAVPGAASNLPRTAMLQSRRAHDDGAADARARRPARISNWLRPAPRARLSFRPCGRRSSRPHRLSRFHLSSSPRLSATCQA
jgi:hypothetical protein